jgi:hypothetical protein
MIEKIVHTAKHAVKAIVLIARAILRSAGLAGVTDAEYGCGMGGILPSLDAEEHSTGDANVTEIRSSAVDLNQAPTTKSMIGVKTCGLLDRCQAFI